MDSLYRTTAFIVKKNYILNIIIYVYTEIVKVTYFLKHRCITVYIMLLRSLLKEKSDSKELKEVWFSLYEIYEKEAWIRSRIPMPARW